MNRLTKLNKKFISFFLAVMMINTLVFTEHKVLAATTAELSISVNDSSNQSIPQYANSGGKSSNNDILNPPVRLAANATAKISYGNFNNVTTAKYQFVTTSSQFPQDSTMTDINLTPPNSQPAYGNDIGDQGTISTMQYVYAGNPSTASSSAQLTRNVSFGTPLSSTMLVQNATVGSDIPNYNVSKSNAFFAGTTKSWSGTVSLSDPTIYSHSNSKKNSTDYVYNPYNKTYCKPNANAAWKAMKFWGYFSPPKSGYYNLGAYSDDGAYGYIVVNGQNKEFVNDWSIASAFPRTNNTPILLSAGSYYPIYIEYYEGCPTQGAFTPVFKYDQSNSANASISKNDTVTYYSDNTIRSDKLMNMQQNWFYSSNTTTPGTIPGAYFGDVSGIPFPIQDGTYYIATKFVSDEGITSGLYGPFIIDKTPPTISNLSVISNNSSSDKKAVAGNTLTISFTASEALQGNPQILINGYVANVTSYTKNSDNNYTATVNIGNDNSINSSGDKITNGPITVQINNYSDLSGNVGSPVQDNSVTFISNSLGITLALAQNSPDANGNVVVTANATAYGNGNSIKTMKYASGNQSINYFTAGGTNLTTTPLTSSYNSNGILQSPVQSTFNVNTNGVYTVYATDNSGNVAVQTINISNIDKTAPTLTFTQSPTGATNGTVTITATASDSGSGVASITKPDGTVVTGDTAIYTVSVNGSYNFTATDNAGNTSPQVSHTVSNIDTTAPTLTFTQSPTGATNGTVTITATASDSGSGVASITKPDGTVVTGDTATYTVSANGSYNFTATDNAGNTSPQVSYTVSNIDNTPLIITIAPYNTSPTNQDITVNATANRGTLNATSHTFTENGSYTFTATDSLGNTASKTVTITNIDKTAPTLTFTQDPTAATEGAVTITATASDNVAVESITKPGNIVVTDSNTTTYTVTANGTYTFKVKDTAGNETTQSIIINNIFAQPSSISAHGIYSGSGIDMANGNNVTSGIPVTMAMVVDSHSLNPLINWSWSSSDGGSITDSQITFKKYEISDSDSGTLGNSQTIATGNSGSINLTDLTIEKDKKYLIVYTITPSGSGSVTVKATADGDETNAKSVTLNIGSRPDLF